MAMIPGPGDGSGVAGDGLEGLAVAGDGVAGLALMTAWPAEGVAVTADWLGEPAEVPHAARTNTVTEAKLARLIRSSRILDGR
jgi:hypothetical protein